MESMAMRIKRLREEAGLSKTDLAKRLGVSRVAVTKYENGGSRPVRRLDQLAAILHTTSDYILTGRQEGEPLPTKLEGLRFLPEEISIIQKYRQLDEKGKITVSAVIEAQLQAPAKPEPAVATAEDERTSQKAATL